MSGSIMALLSAFSFALSNICTRRGVLKIPNAPAGGYITVFISLPLFLLVALASGDIHSIATFTWKGYLWLVIAGIIHFVAGRSFLFNSIKYLGANMASVFSSLNLVYTVLLGFLVLGEQMSRNTVTGALLIIIGPALLAWPQSRKTSNSKQSADSPRLSRQGIASALLTSVFFGSSPLLIKWGLAEGGSPLAGTFISYSSAALIFGITMLNQEKKNEIIHMERHAIGWFLLAGVLGGLAQLFRYVALNLSPISIAGPLNGTGPVFLLALSFALNRKTEVFGINVILGAILVVTGAVLLYR
ncbi:MAG: DMT family transporter [Chloroflexi bacterium]|nr:DMT family transporter [Chloroflexota bacterium]